MTNNKSLPERPTNVRIGYSMPLAAAVSIGMLVTVGLGVYLLLGPVFRATGSQAPATYLLSIVFTIPLILALAERSSVTPGSGGLFNLSRSAGSVPLAFGTGWLLLGGLVALFAIFAWEGGLALSRFLSTYFDFQLEGRWLSAGLVFLVLMRSISYKSDVWKQRTRVVISAVLVLFFGIAVAWILAGKIPSSWEYYPSSSVLKIVPFLAINLWALHFVLDRRDELRRPRRSMLAALWIPIIIGALAGAAASATLLLYPTPLYSLEFPLFNLIQLLSPLLALLLILAMFLFSLMGMNQSFVSITELMSALEGDGFLPPDIRLLGHVWQRPLYTRFIFIILIPAVLLFIPSGRLFAVSAGSFIMASVLVNVQDLFRSKPRIAEDRWPKLPLHPLIPGLAAALGIALVLTLDMAGLLVLIPWIAAGILLYIVYAREGAIAVRRRDAMVTGAILPVKKSNYRVMVTVADPAQAASLVRLGAQIASVHDGRLLILFVSQSSGDDQVDQSQASVAWQELSELLPSQEDIPIVPVPVVRLAADPAHGILTTIWEEKIDIVIMGWPSEPPPNEGAGDGTLGKIVRKAKCEVAVLRGEWHGPVRHILVPVVSAGHSASALALGQDLAFPPEDGGRIVALRVLPGNLTAAKKSRAKQTLRKTSSALADPAGIEGEVISARSTKDGILQEVGDYDALFLGLSDEGFLAKTDFSGLPVDVALKTTGPTVLVKRKERSVQYWLRRSWDELSAVLPTLTPRRRTVVGSEMRKDARADIDFYFLMVMAAAIALFGLLQDSAAVIIGAMLVAPLMSPILAMSHSIVRGQLTMLRQAAESAFRGIVLAITVAALLSLGLIVLGIRIPATSEILARTQPNFLDLLVALASGAAAAYAVSRSEVGAALPGVAIAAALVPPLAVVGYGLGTAQFDYAAGSLLLFLTNLAAIVLAAAVIFLLLGFRPPKRDDRDEQARYGLKIAIVSLILIALPLFATTRTSADQAARDETIYRVIEQYWTPNQAQVTDVIVTEERNEDLRVSCTIFDYADAVDENSLAGLQVELSEALQEPVILNARTIDADLNNYDDASAARELTSTPNPVETPLIGSTSILPHVLDETALPEISETPLPSFTATAHLNTTPTQTPVPVATVEP